MENNADHPVDRNCTALYGIKPVPTSHQCVGTGGLNGFPKTRRNDGMTERPTEQQLANI